MTTNSHTIFRFPGEIQFRQGEKRMKRTVLIFGLISGAISGLMMVITVPFLDSIGFDRAEVLGYTTIILSFLLVYAGIRSHRDTVGRGSIGFGQAFWIGLLITLVSCLCYVVTWEALYFGVGSMRQFMAKYGEYIVDQARPSGVNPPTIQRQMEEMARYKQLYENPLANAAITFLEPFPIGLVITVISAAILRRKKANTTEE